MDDLTKGSIFKRQTSFCNHFLENHSCIFTCILLWFCCFLCFPSVTDSNSCESNIQKQLAGEKKIKNPHTHRPCLYLQREVACPALWIIVIGSPLPDPSKNHSTPEWEIPVKTVAAGKGRRAFSAGKCLCLNAEWNIKTNFSRPHFHSLPLIIL